jgi:dCMP deaminase
VKQVLLYLPVIHAGYQAWLNRHADAIGILLVGNSFQAEFPVMGKEIRALVPAEAAAYLRGRDGLPPVRVVETEEFPDVVSADLLVLPDEAMMRALAERYGLAAGRTVVFERTFLRWDRSWSLPARPAEFDGSIAVDELAQRMISLASATSNYSSDWWRQVGAVVARDQDVVAVAYNEHQPTEYAPYLDGDPRNDFSRGVRPDVSTSLHAEAALIGQAAREGVALRGADLFVTTFPCPACARLITAAGVQRCFFGGPYAVLDGDAILRAAGVEIIWVDMGTAAATVAGGPGTDGNLTPTGS